MPSKKKSSTRKYGKSASKYVESAVRREKKGTLKSGRSGKTVKSRKQAIAIGLSEAREKGAKVPKAPKKQSSSTKTSTKKASTRKTSSRKTSTKKTSTKSSTGRSKKKTSGRGSSSKKSSRK